MIKPPARLYNLTVFFIKTNMFKKTTIICKDCGSEKTHIIGKLPDVYEFAGRKVSTEIKGGFLVECQNCFIKFRSTEFDQSTLTDMYDGGLSEWEVANNRNDWKILTSYIENNYPAEISVLDIGCNRGETLVKINAQNRRFGLEINTKAATIARLNEDLTIWSNYEEIPKNQKFDVIFSTDVIEHISTPTEFLKPLLNMLKDNGSLIISSGDGQNSFAKLFGRKWWYWYFPEHISFISEKWLTKFANDNNLIINEMNNFHYHQISFIKRMRLLVGSLLFSTMSHENQIKILKSIYKTDHPNRFQIGKGVSKDHVFAVLQRK